MGRTSKGESPKKKQLEGKDLTISKNIVDCINAEMQKRNIKYDSKLLEAIEETTNQRIESSRFSLIRNHQSLPNITELCALADYFNLSIDIILNRNTNVLNTDIETVPTAADVLLLIFELRKLTEVSFSQTIDSYDKYELTQEEFWGIYFKHNILVDNESACFFINNVIKDWAKINESVSALDPITKAELLDLWEKKQLEIAESILLTDDFITYKRNKKNGGFTSEFLPF